MKEETEKSIVIHNNIDLPIKFKIDDNTSNIIRGFDILTL